MTTNQKLAGVPQYRVHKLGAGREVPVESYPAAAAMSPTLASGLRDRKEGRGC